jgi:hypothetical protein
VKKLGQKLGTASGVYRTEFLAKRQRISVSCNGLSKLYPRLYCGTIETFTGQLAKRFFNSLTANLFLL